jgi:glycosyltransferase involved in cell wall biosynthesis
MKIIYLINCKTKTSIPTVWHNSLNQNFGDNIVEIVSLKQLSVRNLKSIFNCDVIHGHHIKAMSIFILFNWVFCKKTIYTVHGSFSYLSNLNKKLLAYIFIRTNKIIFVNKYLYDILPDKLKYEIGSKYDIILNGIDLNIKYKNINIYNKYNIGQSDKIIFHPARFVSEKNHINILEAFTLLKEKISTIKLVLAGDGVLKDEIIANIERLGLNNEVILLGIIPKNHVYNLLVKCTLFIMPSKSEGLNVAFLEAMSLRAKILVSNIDQFIYPFEYYAINPINYNVYFTDPNDIESIKNGLECSISNDKNNVFDMSYFDIDNMHKEYIRNYKELL